MALVPTKQNYTRLDLATYSLKWLALAGLVSMAILSVYSARGLYADGSYFLLQILQAHGFYFDDRARIFAEILNQSPVVIPIWAGVTDLNLLIRLHSVGLIALPLAVWLIALVVQIHSERFWFLLLGFCVSYLVSGFFSAGEYSLMFAVSALVWSLLWVKTPNMSAALVIAASCFFLIRAYEGVVFLAPVLLPLVAMRMLESSQERKVAVPLAIAACCLVVATVLAVEAILFPRIPANLAGAVDITYAARSWNFVYALGACFLVAVLVTFRLAGRYATALTYVSVGLSLAFLLFPNQWNEPLMDYASRTLSGVTLAVVFLGGSLVSSKRLEANQVVGPAVAITAFCAYLTLSIPLVSKSIAWIEWASAFEDEASAATGFIPIDQTNLWASATGPQFSWVWTNPSLSVLLRGNSSGGIKNSLTYTGWQPFDPEKGVELLGGYVKNGRLL